MNNKSLDRLLELHNRTELPYFGNNSDVEEFRNLYQSLATQLNDAEKTEYWKNKAELFENKIHELMKLSTTDTLRQKIEHDITELESEVRMWDKRYDSTNNVIDQATYLVGRRKAQYALDIIKSLLESDKT